MDGRVFRNLEEVRAAVTEFAERNNRHWRVEKLGFLSPIEPCQAFAMMHGGLSCKPVSNQSELVHRLFGAN